MVGAKRHSPAKPSVSSASATAATFACAAGTVLPSDVTPTTVTCEVAEPIEMLLNMGREV